MGGSTFELRGCLENFSRRGLINETKYILLHKYICYIQFSSIHIYNSKNYNK